MPRKKNSDIIARIGAFVNRKMKKLPKEKKPAGFPAGLML